MPRVSSLPLPEAVREWFSSLDEPSKQGLADLDSPLDIGLAALLIAEDAGSTKGLTAYQIAQALEEAGVGRAAPDYHCRLRPRPKQDRPRSSRQ